MRARECGQHRLVIAASMMQRRFARTALTAALIAAGAVAMPNASASGPASPDRDSLYTYSGTKPLADIPPGPVLKSRTIHAAVGTTSTPMTAVQLLYRTTGQLGQPTDTVTTVLQP